jgi:hypothetical protein
LGLDGGQGRQPTRLGNVVWASAEGSGEWRDTSRRKRGNAPCWDVDPNTGSEEDEHDDQDDY